MKGNIFQYIETLCWILNIYGFELNFPPVDNRASTKIRFFIFSFLFGTLFLSECCALAILDLNAEKLNQAFVYTFGHATLIGKFLSVFLRRKKFNRILTFLFNELPKYKMTPNLQLEADLKAWRAFSSFPTLLAITTFFLIATEAHVALSNGTLFDPMILWVPGGGDVADWIQISMIPLCYFPVCVLYGCLEVVTIVVLVYIEVRFKEVSLLMKNLKLGSDKKLELKQVIRLHTKTLECAEEIQYVFGTLYGMQILQSVFMMAFSVIDLLTNRDAVAVLIKTLLMISALLFILSQYTWTAGDVTYAALSVSEAVGMSDWSEYDVDTRKALVLVTMRAQRPLLFRGFNYVALSHGLFVTIVQRTYSVVALLY